MISTCKKYVYKWDYSCTDTREFLDMEATTALTVYHNSIHLRVGTSDRKSWRKRDLLSSEPHSVVYMNLEPCSGYTMLGKGRNPLQSIYVHHPRVFIKTNKTKKWKNVRTRKRNLA